MVTAVVLLAVLSPFIVMALYVDDWSRDLTTNTAATSPEAIDERLRPLEVDASPAAVRAVTRAFAETQAAWTVAEEDKPLPSDSPIRTPASEASATTIHLVRTTGLMGYRDDIWLVIEPTDDGGARLHADSRSRVGKGDLGQNPRNLRELLAALEEASRS